MTAEHFFILFDGIPFDGAISFIAIAPVGSSSFSTIRWLIIITISTVLITAVTVSTILVAAVLISAVLIAAVLVSAVASVLISVASIITPVIIGWLSFNLDIDS
jgi:hypothetical protein